MEMQIAMLWFKTTTMEVIRDATKHNESYTFNVEADFDADNKHFT